MIFKVENGRQLQKYLFIGIPECVTGSNIIICEKIAIMFSQLNGKAGRPVTVHVHRY